MISRESFGNTEYGEPVYRYTVRDNNGCGADFLSYGCIIQSVLLRDRQGALQDVCLGYDTLSEYQQNADYMGAVLGRCANRIANARFELDGQTYYLSKNDGRHHIHGGAEGFHRKVWTSQIISEDTVRFFRISNDGEEGYPGNLIVSVEYCFRDNCLHITYDATPDANTVVSLSNHSYFDLSGGSGDALEHWLLVNSNAYSENDSESIPTGRLLPVEDTPFDFRKGCLIGERINQKTDQLIRCGGYDHDFLLQGTETAALLWHKSSGIRMTVRTNMPSLEVYTANALGSGVRGKHGRIYYPRAGVCLETQHIPNAIWHPQFLSPILRQGQRFLSRTSYCFDVVNV